MLNKKFKLQDTLDVYLSELEDEKVLITFNRMTTRERKEIIAHQIIAKILASLDGERTVEDILNSFGKFNESAAIKFLNFLVSEHFVYEACEKKFNGSRYSRQIAYFDDMVFNHSGLVSQQLLKQKHIVIIGCGAVTGAMAEILVRAGVEKLTLVDYQKVRQSDLLRHIFCREENIGEYKIDVLYQYLKRINSRVEISLFYDMLRPQTDLNQWIADDISLVINGCDEPYIGHTSLKIGRFVQKKNIPMYVMGGFDAHLMSSGELVFPPRTPCIDCCQQTFQKALTDWKPIYKDISVSDSFIGTDISVENRVVADIGGAGGISVMSSFSANLSCLRIIHFLIEDNNFDYTAERHEYLVNKGEMTAFQMRKQEGFCRICCNG